VTIAAAEHPEFVFLAGDACLDFVNTRPIVKGRTADLLMTYDDFVRWLTRAGRMDARSAAEAVKRWGEGSEATTIIERARAFRETLRQMIDGIVRGRGVSTEGFAAINSILAENDGRCASSGQGSGFRTRFAARPAQPVALLGTVAEAAAELLTTRNPRLVRRCGNPDCVLFFYDATRNHRRQWCAMATCGNLMKVRAFRKRQRR
jgi:predicted RNA-binding Zn ribbon-like protein